MPKIKDRDKHSCVTTEDFRSFIQMTKIAQRYGRKKINKSYYLVGTVEAWTKDEFGDLRPGGPLEKAVTKELTKELRRHVRHHKQKDD